MISTARQSAGVDAGHGVVSIGAGRGSASGVAMQLLGGGADLPYLVRTRTSGDDVMMRGAFLASAAMVLSVGSAMAQTTVTIPLGAGIQAAINANPAGTVFDLVAGSYSGQSFSPQSNDQFIGAAGGGTVFNGGGQTSPMVTNNGATGVVFQNVTTTNFNTPAQVAPIQTGAGWQILNVTSTNNGGAGLYVGGPNNLVQGGSFSNNGQEGIDGSSANGSKIIGVTANGNNTANYDQGWDAGGIKITNTNGLTITGSTVSNNNGNGIWADINSNNWTITDNGVANNNGNGIMYEISHGATKIANNLIANNTGSAIYISNSDGVTATGNGVVIPAGNTLHGDGTGGGIVVWDNSGRGADPSGQPYLANNDTVTGNTIIGDAAEAMSGVFSVLGTPVNDTVANNTFETLSTAAAQAEQIARQAAQAAANTASQIAGAAASAITPALKAVAPVIGATTAPQPAASTAVTGAAPTAPQTSLPSPAASVPSLPPESAPVQASSLPDPPTLPAGMTVPAGYTSGSASDQPVSAGAQSAVAQGSALKQQADGILAGVLAIMPPGGGR